ncbi:MAG TPA: hypothetical protein VIC51_03065 [Psychromonas sp.]
MTKQKRFSLKLMAQCVTIDQDFTVKELTAVINSRNCNTKAGVVSRQIKKLREIAGITVLPTNPPQYRLSKEQVDLMFVLADAPIEYHKRKVVDGVKEMPWLGSSMKGTPGTTVRMKAAI